VLGCAAQIKRMSAADQHKFERARGLAFKQKGFNDLADITAQRLGGGFCGMGAVGQGNDVNLQPSCDGRLFDAFGAFSYWSLRDCFT
jgi:hypothetical protein